MDPKLEAALIAILADIADRRAPDERATLVNYLGELSRQIDEGGGLDLASELRGIAQLISRYPRVEP
jgi:hypothetical protein